jgi:hypothetical protein
LGRKEVPFLEGTAGGVAPQVPSTRPRERLQIGFEQT